MNVGTLYVVATPIGNLGDMTPRALEVLQKVARIAAEDTRHSAGLLRHFGIATPLFALHEHNEREASAKVVGWLQQGGVPIFDGDDEDDNVEHTNLTYVRADALSALDAARREIQAMELEGRRS